jgi:hypothetical protein
MSIRTLCLGLLAACALAPAMASEVVDVRLRSIALEGDRGEKLVVSSKDGRIVELRLEDDRGAWLLPADALDASFRADLTETRFYHYDQRGKPGYRVRFSGSFIDGAHSLRGQQAFEFLDGRLIARENWEPAGSDYELVSTKAF